MVHVVCHFMLHHCSFHLLLLLITCNSPRIMGLEILLAVVLLTRPQQIAGLSVELPRVRMASSTWQQVELLSTNKDCAYDLLWDRAPVD